jgi:alcohol dehydrogenase
MAKTVKAAVLVEPKRMELREFPFPEIGEDDALLRVESAGVCGTDFKLYHGLSFRKIFPSILGHEILGRIERVGKKMAAHHHVQPGDRVVVEAAVPCGECTFCQESLYRFCRQARSYGFTGVDAPQYLWGAFSEFMYIAPNSVLHKIADHVDSKAAVVAASCLANGIRWTRTLGNATVAKPVVIQGVGPQGLAAVVAAKESGACPILITGLTSDGARLALARELGADISINAEKENVLQVVEEATHGNLADTVIDVTGNAQAIALSVKLVKPLGTLVCGGTIAGGAPASIPTNDIVSKEIRFQGAWNHSFESAGQAIRLAEKKKYPLEKIISHEFSLDECETAVKAVGREIEGLDPIKVAVRPF